MHPLLADIEALQDLVVAHATGSMEDDGEYVRLRRVVLGEPASERFVPRFVVECRSLGQFWEFIKTKGATYAERRKYIWAEFRPMIDVLERGGGSPADAVVTGAIEAFDAEHVQAAWMKALERRGSDPEGAITVARTLLESVCKHILEEGEVEYEENPDLAKLYRLTSTHLKLAPSQHTELVFKQILGGCASVVEGLGALRNRLGDSHGTGKKGVKPAPRHAELAVNLAGALATYLLATKNARDEAGTGAPDPTKS